MPHSRVGILNSRPRTIDVRELDVPRLGPDGELVIRTVLCGICGSDLHRFTGSTARETILGHEILGRVVQLPPGGWLDAGGQPLAAGDLVVPETRIPCHQCEYCRGVGSRPQKLLDYSHCPQQRGLGGIPLDEKPTLSGGWSDFVELPVGAIVHRIQPSIAPEAAVLLEPFSVAMKAVRLAGITVDDSVVVLGPGPIGLLAVVAAREAGARQIVLAGARGDEQRLRLGRELGAHAALNMTEADPLEGLRAANRGRLATRTIDATGTVAGFELGIQLLDRGGVLVTVGGSRPEQRASVSPTDLVMRQIDIRGSQLGANQYEACIAVLASGRYPLERLVTHRFPVGSLEQAMLTFEARGACIKPVITFE
ncbi:MAG: zinc-binding dehydrogenase [Chloroflexota bacterium]|nr:zinc-binding dehydrogenase [Chloroflexota bacterium]